MTDPKRWLDDADDAEEWLKNQEWSQDHDAGVLTSEERQVLAADSRFAPPPEARSRLWSPLAAAIGTAAVVRALSSAGSAGSSVGVATQAAAGSVSVGHALGLGAVVKLTLVGIGIGTSVATVNHLWSAREVRDTPPMVTATRVSVAQSAAAVSASAAPTPSNAKPSEPAPHRTGDSHGSSAVLAPVNAPEPVEVQSGVHSPSDAARTVEVPAASGRALAPPEPRLEKTSPKNHVSADAREESQLVGSARSMLRAGNAAVALQLIELATSRFPGGILIQEREALRIEALAALGRTSEARARADAFVRAYPNSPHVSRVKGRE